MLPVGLRELLRGGDGLGTGFGEAFGVHGRPPGWKQGGALMLSLF
jgi:hypothetical protein